MCVDLAYVLYVSLCLLLLLLCYCSLLLFDCRHMFVYLLLLLISHLLTNTYWYFVTLVPHDINGGANKQRKERAKGRASDPIP